MCIKQSCISFYLKARVNIKKHSSLYAEKYQLFNYISLINQKQQNANKNSTGFIIIFRSSELLIIINIFYNILL